MTETVKQKKKNKSRGGNEQFKNIEIVDLIQRMRDRQREVEKIEHSIWLRSLNLIEMYATSIQFQSTFCH